MRFVSLTVVTATGFILAACGGGGSSPSLTLSDGLDVCGLNCPEEPQVSKPGSGAVGNLPTTPTTGNSGNPVKLAETAGDTTFALEKSILINTKDKLARSKLTLGAGNTTALLEIDTKTGRNKMWPKPKVMDYYAFGSAADDGLNPDRLGATSYKEYRKLTSSIDQGTSVDEELQVWKWRHSYGTQYRDVTSGGPDADHQAWSFGGTRTTMANMPTGGSATYTGSFGSTALTSQWIDTQDQRQTISYNNNWRVVGDSSTTVNFGTNAVNATLTPTKWNAYQTKNGATGFLTVDVTGTPATDPLDPLYNPNQAFFMYSKIRLKGTLTKDATIGNAIKGDAFVDSVDGWISNSSSNPFAAALFGPDGDEITGIFNVEAAHPSPVGGDLPINGDRRGKIQHSGVFNGTAP